MMAVKELVWPGVSTATNSTPSDPKTIVELAYMHDLNSPDVFITSIELALDAINSRSDILPTTHLVLDTRNFTTAEEMVDQAVQLALQTGYPDDPLRYYVPGTKPLLCPQPCL